MDAKLTKGQRETLDYLEEKLQDSEGIVNTIIEHVLDAECLYGDEFDDLDLDKVYVYDLNIRLSQEE